MGQYGANAMVLGVLVGALGSKIGGTRRMLYLAPAIGLAAGLGAFTAYDWWWVGLLAAAGVVAGAGIGFGWMLPLLMIPLVATFASPVSSGQHAVAYGVIAAVATGYGIVLARRFGAAAVVEGQRVRAAHATVVALVFGAILGGAAAIGVALGWTEPYWVPEPILLLALYVLIGRRERIGKGDRHCGRRGRRDPHRDHRAPDMGHRADRRRCFRARGHANQDVLAQLWPVHVRPRSGPRASRPGRLRRRSSVVSKSSPVSPFSWSVWSSSTLRAGGWPSITPNPNSPLRLLETEARLRFAIGHARTRSPEFSFSLPTRPHDQTVLSRLAAVLEAPDPDFAIVIL